MWDMGAGVSPQSRCFYTVSYSMFSSKVGPVGPVWNTTFSSKKENNEYLGERFSNVSVDKMTSIAYSYSKALGPGF